MHICQIIDSFSIGGAQKVVINFCKLAKAKNIDASVIILATSQSDTMIKELNKTGVPIHMIAADKLSNPRRLIRLIRFLRKEKYDLVQTHLAYANILGVVACFLAGIPTVSTLHSAKIHHEYYREILFNAEIFSLRFLTKGIICVAQAVADIFKQYIGEKKIVIIPNPVEDIPPLDSEERTAVRTELIGDPDKILLLSVGRLITAKGYSDLIDAFVKINTQRSQTMLLIVGPGMLEASLREQINRLNLNDRVFLLGERTDVPRLLAASDVFICSSHWEGMPIAVLEAMTAGLPVVSTAVAGLVDIVGNRGILVPAKDPDALAQAVVDLLDKPEEMQRLGALAQEYVQKRHSLEVWGSMLFDYFNKFLKVNIFTEPAILENNRMTIDHQNSPERTPEQIREHYLVEKELADRLRQVGKEERQNLYPILYDELYRRVPNHPGLTRKKSSEITREEVEGQMVFLREHLNKNSVFLEIGAGDCALSFETAKFVQRVIAIDVSAIKTESSSKPSNFELILTTGTKIPLPDNSIDIAYSHAFFEHLHPEDGVDHLINVLRVLKPGGIYLCIVPQRLNGPWDISRAFDQMPSGFHMKEYTACELEAIFKQTGFSKAKIFLHIPGKFIALPKGLIWIYESLFSIMPFPIRQPLASRFLFENVRIIGRK